MTIFTRQGQEGIYVASYTKVSPSSRKCKTTINNILDNNLKMNGKEKEIRSIIIKNGSITRAPFLLPRF